MNNYILSQQNRSYDSRLSLLIIWLIILGYPFSAVISSFISIESNYISITYRVGFLLIVIFTFLYSLFSKFSFSISILLLIFMGLYSIRIVYDNSRGIYLSDTAMYFFFSATLPAVFVAFTISRIRLNELSLAKSISNGVFLVISASYLLIAFGIDPNVWGGDSFPISRFGLERLNPIAMGFVCAFGIASSLFLLETRRSLTFNYKFLLITSVVLFANFLIKAQSRSFIIAILLSVSIYYYSIRRFRYFLLIPIFILFSLLISGNEYIQATINRFLENADSSMSNSLRLMAWSQSWQSMINFPLFGEFYFNSSTELNSAPMAPHNLWLEAGMALGVPGFLIFLSLTIRAIWKVLRGCIHSAPLISMYFIICLSVSFVSGNIWGGQTFLFFLAYILAIPCKPALRN